MQLAKHNQNLSTGGDVKSSSQFSIAVNAKMFDVLSNSMYEDKVGSIVREICSNAVDGHTKAGTPDKPFTVHVPNAIEPWFSVKDEGVGMSAEVIEEVYSTYGVSTKDQSNDEIGAFGLGSKTPFAYTDQFTIISIHAGVKSTYTAFRGNDGLPVINLLSTEETSEHAGVEVNIAVNKEDFQEFQKKILSQLKFFKVKPKLTMAGQGASEMKFADLSRNVSYESDKVRVYSGRSGYGYNSDSGDPVSGMWIVQGGVGYRLSIANLGSIDSEVRDFAHALESQNSYLMFPIGDIEVTSNREGISYERPTIDAITRRLKEVSQEMAKEIHAKLKAEKSLWNRVAIYNKQMDVMRRAIRNLSDFDTLFNGAVVKGSNNMTIAVTDLNDEGFDAVWMSKYQYTSRKGGYNYVTKVKRKVVGGTDGGRWGSEVTLQPAEDIRIFVRDTNSKPMARMQKLCEDENYPPILVIESSTKADITAKDIQNIAKALRLDVSTFEKLSDLPAPKVTSSGSRADKRPRAFKFDATNHRESVDSSRDWTPLYDDLDDLDDSIIVAMDRHSILANDRRRYMMVVRAIQKLASKHSFLDKPMIAVNMQTFQRFQDGKIGAQHTYWEDVADKVVDIFNEKMPIYLSYTKYAGYSNALEKRSIFSKIWSRDHSAVPVLNKVGAVNRRKDQLLDRIGDKEIASMINSFADQTKFDTGQINEAHTAGVEAGQERLRVLIDKYPMLRFVGGYPSDEDTDEAIKYMKMVDGA